MNPAPKSTTAMNTANSTQYQTASEARSREWPPPWSLQCRLMTFERPNYFCGHLLTDTDLTLQQRYFREKTRLYHRTLHGHGVVCGLRLTCDHDCSGKVLVSSGYAIDNCGNDLIVAEKTPVDVVKPLVHRNKTGVHNIKAPFELGAQGVDLRIYVRHQEADQDGIKQNRNTKREI